MSAPWEPILIGATSLLVSGMSFIYASRAQLENRRAEEARTSKQLDAARQAVDAAAYERAKNLYEAAIANMERQNASLRDEVEQLSRENAELRRKVAVLEHRLDQLEAIQEQKREG